MNWILLLVGLAAHAILLWRHFELMWHVEHFQYFPIALLAAGVLLYTKRGQLRQILASSNQDPIRINQPLLLGAICLNVVILTFGILVGMRMAGWVSFLLFCSILTYVTYGWNGIKVISPVLVLLLIIRPLAGASEMAVTLWMQNVASSLSSSLLDMLGISHFRQGLVLVLSDQSFMAEEACSGIRSLFSSITAIVFWGLLHRYHWSHHLFNVVQTIFWVIVFNAIRIAVVVWVEHNTSFSLATGINHDMLGLVVFFSIFAMVLSTDQLVLSMFPPKQLLDEDEELVEGDITEVNATPSSESKLAWSDWLQWRASPVFGSLFLGALLLLALGSARLQASKAIFSVYNEAALPTPREDYIPKQLAGWSVVKYEHVQRTEHHQMGSDSYMWHLEKDDRKLVLSVDGSFEGYHDLGFCYTNIGWLVDIDRNYSEIAESTEQSQETDNFTRLTLSRYPKEYGVVLFSAIDRKGTIVFPNYDDLKSIPTRLLFSVRSIIGMNTMAEVLNLTYEPPVTTIQLVSLSKEPTTEAEFAELRALFLEAREILRKSPRFSQTKG
jgi:exosortase